MKVGGADPAAISDELTAFNNYDVWGLCEVNPVDAERYVEAIADSEWPEVEYKLGTTGGSDRLLMAWNPTKLQMIQTVELLQLRAMTGRAPIAVRLKELPHGPEFWFMMNHLHRVNPAKRMEQTVGVKQWMSQQSIPVFAQGDYNYDYDIGTNEGNEAYAAMSQGSTVKWIRPPAPIRTQRSFNSVLDFVWTNPLADAWSPTSTIVVREHDFDADDVPLRSDHRPVTAHFMTSRGVLGGPFAVAMPRIRSVSPMATAIAPPVTGRSFLPSATLPLADGVSASSSSIASTTMDRRHALILQRIQAMRLELDELRQMLEQSR